MSPTLGTTAKTPSMAKSVWRMVARAASLTLTAMTWACGNSDTTTSPALRAGAANHDATSAASGPKAELIPGQYIITFSDSVSDVPGLAKRIAAQYGKEPMFTYTSAIKGFAARLPEQAVDALSHNPQIQRIEQDAVLSLEGSGTQSSPTWNLDRIDQKFLPLDLQFAYSADGVGVNIYIIDSGIRTSHTDFGGRAYGAFTAINDGYGTNDCIGHGTGVADVAGGTKYGVAKAAKLYAVRVVDCSGYSAYSNLIAGIDWVTKNRILPAVANISIAGGKSSTVNSAVENSIAAGVVYAVGAANQSTDACNFSPASAPHALTVAASGQDLWTGADVQSSYSNFGSCVDLYAPGDAIRAAYDTSDVATTAWTGTSFSSPHVAGVAALYLSAFPSATPAQVASAIISGATQNVIGNVGAGTPNLLLNSNVIGPTPPPPDTTTTTSTSGTGAQPPVASFSVNGCPRSTCTFDGSASTAVNGIASYSWNFGDGGTTAATGSSAAKASHTYKSKGVFVVTLTVVDKLGLSTAASQTVNIKK